MSVSRRTLLSALPALAATPLAFPPRVESQPDGLSRDEAVELFLAMNCVTAKGWHYSVTIDGPTEFDEQGRSISYNVREAPFVALSLRLCGERKP